ncbi:hypothetical protein [Shewanella marina]|uniref:hypothetical protein n=1 Tax=Shewanella marina TaxID=487319 RepID=UPI00046F8ABC|nr:hypothetical protein [Shewanella marina]
MELTQIKQQYQSLSQLVEVIEKRPLFTCANEAKQALTQSHQLTGLLIKQLEQLNQNIASLKQGG